MAIVLSDRTKETTLTEGTADLVLEGTSGGFNTFQNGIGNGKETYYTIENFGRWEVGVGTYTASTNTLSRDTVLASNNFDTVDGSVLKISLAGVSTVFVTYTAARAVFLDNEGYATSTVPGYLGVKFPNGSTQTYATYLTGTGSENSIAFWDGSTSFDYDTNLQWNPDTNTLTNQGVIELHPATGLPLKIKRTSGGNIFHGHVNTGKRLGLHLTGDASPTWTLGLQDGISDTTTPTKEYAYGGSSSVGMYAATDTAFIINYSNGFWVKHKNAALFNVGTHGTTVYNDSASAVAATVKGASAQSANLQEWTNISDTVLASVSSAGAITVPALYFNDGTSQTTAIPTDTNPDHTHRRRYTTIADSAILTPSHDAVFVDSSSGSVTITLPTAVDNGGEEFTIKRATGNNTVTINTYSSETIDGESSFDIEHLYEAVNIISDNSNWYLI